VDEDGKILYTFGGATTLMPRPDQYARIAERYATAADRSLPDIQEAGGFCAYHAFESIGGAWIRRCGHQVPRSHVRKLNLFVRLSSNMNFGPDVATNAALLNSLRNQMLYPVPVGQGAYLLPEVTISPPQAADRLRRVQGIIQQVSANL
jgi:hypothetical protein